MDAPPALEPREIQFKLDNINCFKHPNNKIVGICIDKNCKNEDKFMCVDCIFESHSGHKGIKSGEIEDLYKQQLYRNSGQNKDLNDEFLKFEKHIKNKIDEIKNKLNEGVEKFHKEILDDFKKVKNKLNISEDIDMNMIINNYPPKNKEELNELITAFLKLYNNKNNKDNKSYGNNSNNINNQNKKLLIENAANYYDKILQNTKKDLEKYISELKLFKILKFEWSTKTYGKYDFYYKLEENNSKATKISGEGTNTICRGTKPLQKGKKYKLDYYIDYFDGEFDVGFGDDQEGDMDWLRGNNLYGFTNDGIFINGKKNEDYKIKKENKKITFIIDLKNNIFEIFMDGRKLDNTNEMKPENTYYPMISMKELNNSVKLNLTEIF